LTSIDTTVPYSETPISVTVDPIGAAEGADVGSCENELGIGDAAVISFDVPELSDLYISFGGRSFERVMYLRSACEDDPEIDDDELLCRVTSANTVARQSLIEAGRYYLHIKRTNVLDIEPFDVEIRLVSRVTECNDGQDNDLDGLTDLFDYGCFNGDDNSELTGDDEPLPVCANLEDDDEDGLTDYPEDDGCISAGSDYETPGCLNIEAAAYVGDIGGVVSVDTSLGEHNYTATCSSSFSPSSSPEQMVQLTLSNPSQVNILVSNGSTGFDSVIYLRSACEADEPDSYCDDTGIASEELSFARLEPGRYFVFVDGYGTDDVGTLDLTFEVTSLVTECNDGEDNDEDGQIDNADIGCFGESDTTEGSDAEPDFVIPECADGEDNDEDGTTDYPDDAECLFAGGVSEVPICNTLNFADAGTGGTFSFDPEVDYDGDGVGCAPSSGEEAVYRVQVTELSRVTVNVTDDDGDPSFVYTALRSDCDDAISELECYSSFPTGPKEFNNLEPGYYFVIVHRSAFSIEDPFNVEITVESLVRECNDGEDNDMDGLIDDNDVGCSNGLDDSENTDSEVDFVLPQCADLEDNDMDGQIDYPEDSDCDRAGDDSESPVCEAYDGELIVVSESTSESLVFDTSTSSNNYLVRPGSFSSTGPEIPFVLFLEADSDVVITLGSDFDTYLHMRAGVCDDPNALYDFNDDTNGVNSELNMTNVPAGIYYVFVDGYGAGSSGQITVDVTINPSGI
jgi:hypothetical protein